MSMHCGCHQAGLVIQSFVLAKAVLHAGMNRKRLRKVQCLIGAMNFPLKFQQRTNSSSTTVHIITIRSF